MIRALVLFLVAIGSAIPAQADLKDFYWRRHAERRLEKASGSTELVFEQKIDPKNPADARTFKQRYFLNSTYAAGADSPVFYYICGEATCSGEFRGAALGYAKKYKGHLVALEHRYYGKSQPFATLTAENLAYLSTENALEDLAAFERFAVTEHGLTGKWFTIGGSYAGSLAAYYRLRFPELTAGSLSSSGPVMARAAFEEYDETVTRVAGPECSDAMRGVVARVEGALADPIGLGRIKKVFGAEDVRDPVDFLYVLADMAAIAVQYGHRDEFCGALLSASDPLVGYAQAGLELFRAFGLTPVSDSFQGAENLDPDSYYDSFGMRQWMWQSCTEYGYWQVAHHDPARSARSALIDQKYHDQVCNRLFGLSHPVDTSRINHALYEPLLERSVTRILYTNGSTDPWAALSITAANGNDTNPGTPTFLIEGGSHCSDLGSLAASGSVQSAQQLFMEKLESWMN